MKTRHPMTLRHPVLVYRAPVSVHRFLLSVHTALLSVYWSLLCVRRAQHVPLRLCVCHMAFVYITVCDFVAVT